jgi:Lrp/AsnC family transcriptional regulator, leucine-responsive regulatory protein
MKYIDIRLLSILRADARRKATDIARELKMPVTTVYDRLRTHTKQGYVTKRVALLDFNRLGYGSVALVAFANRRLLGKFLVEHPNVNSLHLASMGTELIAETIFRSPEELHEFVGMIDRRFGSEGKVFHILHEMKREGFVPVQRPSP